MRADFITLAARTGGPGASGVSLILGSGLIDQSQKATAAAMQIADK
jgi:hypothetical protein